MKTHDEMVRDWMQDFAFVQEYNDLEEDSPYSTSYCERGRRPA